MICPMSKVHCFSCKRARDALWKLAKRQDALEWFRKMEASDQWFQEMISTYKEKTQPLEGAGSGKKNRFDFLTYFESTECSSELLKDAVMEMMCEEDHSAASAALRLLSHSFMCRVVVKSRKEALSTP